MAQETKIELSDEARALLADLEALPEVAARKIAHEIDQQNVLTVSHIQKEYESFPKDGPTVAIGTRVITGRLRGSLRNSKAEVIGDRIESGIGSNLVYAAPQEFGATIHVGQRTGTVRLATDRKGNLMRQQGHDHLAVFAKRSRKSWYREKAFTAAAHDIVLPARGMVQRGLADRSEEYGSGVSGAVIDALKGN